jgi:glycerol-3-phosphate dehydrogenase
VGTTDTDYKEDLDAVGGTREEVNYLLEGLHIAYPEVKFEDVYYTYAGLRSLALKPGKTASDTSRSHALIDHSMRDGLDGLVTMLGGKITAYREVARDAADLVSRKLKNTARCTTGVKPLPGAPAVKQVDIDQSVAQSGLPRKTVEHLARLYGSRYREVLEMASRDNDLKLPLCSNHPDIAAQVWHAIERESAVTINDFMLRRSVIGLQPDLGISAVKAVAAEMRKALNWSAEEESKQVEAYNQYIALSRRFLGT